MAEATTPAPEKSKYAGIYIGGTVTGKKHGLARTNDQGEPIPESWRVELSWFGGSASVKVSQKQYDRVAVGQDTIFIVSQTTFKGSIYNTAIEQ